VWETCFQTPATTLVTVWVTPPKPRVAHVSLQGAQSAALAVSWGGGAVVASTIEEKSGSNCEEGGT
jgi:hypothetical protein